MEKSSKNNHTNVPFQNSRKFHRRVQLEWTEIGG
uniref:Uncharacterized protein n=1 Tax=Timema monikensis TaxID=170555 RepID=A0A7R9EMG3_9NEOP|nr:unnamed protein product [Timema monikensis]